MSDRFAPYLAKLLTAQGYRPGLPPEAAVFAPACHIALTRLDGLTVEIACIVDRELAPEAVFSLPAETIQSALTACLAYCGTMNRNRMPARLTVYEVGDTKRDPVQTARLVGLTDRSRTTPVVAWALDTVRRTAWSPGRGIPSMLAGLRLQRMLRAPRLSDAELIRRQGSAEIPAGKPRVTHGLLLLLAVLFLAECSIALRLPGGLGSLLGVPTRVLYLLGATTGGLLLSGQELWRGMTAAFLHASLLHILFNGFALLLVGGLLEPQVGRLWFLALFFVCAAGGSLASGVFDPQVLSVGASGAILGLAGAALIVSGRLHHMRRSQARTTLLQVLVPSLLPVFFLGNGPHIDYGAHIGGAVTGIACGGVLRAIWPEGAPHPAFRPVAILLVLLGAAVTAFGFWVVAQRLAAFGLL